MGVRAWVHTHMYAYIHVHACTCVWHVCECVCVCDSYQREMWPQEPPPSSCGERIDAELWKQVGGGFCLGLGWGQSRSPLTPLPITRVFSHLQQRAGLGGSGETKGTSSTQGRGVESGGTRVQGRMGLN